tara:strand:+ start:10423 stop:10941 length:519 start_codon:yes stop_codon:yes gene_type:complete
MANRSKLYTKSLLSKNVTIPFTKIGKHIDKLLLTKIKNKYEGKCISEGYVKNNSCKIVSYSSGTILDGDEADFLVVFECDICLPMEGLKVECIIRNITKAGLRAEINEDVSPIVIYLARDHHYNNTIFSKINIGDTINVKVIGKRYELNDPNISILGELIDSIVKRERLEIE